MSDQEVGEIAATRERERERDGGQEAQDDKVAASY